MPSKNRALVWLICQSLNNLKPPLNYSNLMVWLKPFQEKVVLVTPSSLPLKNWHGIMNVSFALCAKNLWSEKVSSRTKVISFARNVPEKKCWKKWRPKTKSSHLRWQSHRSYHLKTVRNNGFFKFWNLARFKKESWKFASLLKSLKKSMKKT